MLSNPAIGPVAASTAMTQNPETKELDARLAEK